MNPERRPSLFVRAVARIRALTTRGRAEAELEEELRFHVEMETRANIEHGMTPGDARRAALRDFGGVTQTTEAVRDVRRLPLIEHVVQDVRGALRRVKREPGFAAAVVLTIGLAIGLATTLYAVAAGVLLRPLPFDRPSELVQVWKTTPKWGRVAVSVPEFLEWQSECRSFAALGAARFAGFHMSTPGGSEWAEGVAVSSSLFPLLGVKPLLGRLFRVGEDQAGYNHVVVLDEGYWRRAFGADPTVIGRRVHVATDDRRYEGTDSLEVVGVVPSSVRLRYSPSAQHFDLYVPLTPHPLERQPSARNGVSLWVFGRLRAGVAPEQARAEVETVFKRRSSQFIRQVPGASVEVSNLHADLLGQTRPAFLLLSAAILVVLLIAGANLINLLLACGVRRSEELATRLALGCSRGRLVQQLVSEHVVVAIGGGVLGALMALTATPLVARLAPATLPRLDQVRFDVSAAGFALILACGFGLTFSLLSALVVSRPGVLGLVPGRPFTAGRRIRLRSALVVAEAALVVVLLAGAGLVLSSFLRLSRVELGFDPHNVFAVETIAPRDYWKAHAAARAETLARLRARPGIIEASWATDLPFSERPLWSYRLADGSEHNGMVIGATPGFLRSLRVPLLSGRLLTEADEAAPRTAIVSQSLARSLFPAGNAVGQRVGIEEWYEIVGVVGDVTEIASVRNGTLREKGLNRATIPQIYLPSTAVLDLWPNLVVRSDGSVRNLLALVLADLHAVAPVVSVRGTCTLDDRVASAGIDTRFYAGILGTFAVVSFVLAAVGLFGVLVYDVTRRSREFGVRLALGASASAVRLLVLRQALIMAGGGAVVGLSLALAGGRAIKGFLFELSPSDPWTLTASVLVLTIGGLVAAYLPARRASRIDPMAALRCE